MLPYSVLSAAGKRLRKRERGHAMPDTGITRRTLLAAAAATVPAQTAAPVPIIDTHFHLYDPTRPQGSPLSLYAQRPSLLTA